MEMRDKPAGNQGGFTYIDVMMAIGVMTIGVFGLLMTLTTSMVASTQGEYQVLAKQLATSTMESIFSARDINNSTITNSTTGATNMAILINSPSGGGSIFPTGAQPIFVLPTSATNSTATPVLSAGPDGIVGTSDDNQAVPSTGPAPVVLPSFTRTITVTNLSNNVSNTINLISIQVTINYVVNNFNFSQSMTSYMALYNTQNINGTVQ
jgi:hypothetical protein